MATAGSIGIGRRFLLAGETAVVWAGSNDGSYSLTDGSGNVLQMTLQDSTGKVVATAYPHMQFGMTGDLTAPSTPGTYNLVCKGIRYGQVTVWANPTRVGNRYIITKESDLDGLQTGDNDVIIIDGSIELTKTRRFSGVITFMGGELVINTPSSFYDSLINGGLITLKNMTIRQKQGYGRLVYADFLTLDNVEVISCGLNKNGGPINNLKAISCRFRNGAGISAGNSSFLKNCTWEGRPRYAHPLEMNGDEICVCYSQWFSTERAWLSHGSQRAVVSCTFTDVSGTPNQQEQGMIEDGALSQNYLIAYNVYKGGVGPAFQAWNNQGQAPFTVKNIYTYRNVFNGNQKAIMLYSPNNGGTIDNFVSYGDFYENCQAVAYSYGNVTNAVIDTATVINQTPQMNLSWSFKPEDGNPNPVKLTDLVWDPAFGTVTSASGLFTQAQEGCILHITGGTGWPVEGVNGNWQQVYKYIDKNTIKVRNYMGSSKITGGMAYIDGLYLITGSVKMKNSRLHNVRCKDGIDSSNIFAY